METIGASHSIAAARHFSSGTMSLRDVEYSRMRPQPVQVRLHVCSGSSCRTMANFGVWRSLCLMIWPAIFADRAKGNRIELAGLSELLGWFGRNHGPAGDCRRGHIVLHARKKEGRGRNGAAKVDASAPGQGQGTCRQHCQPQEFPI